MNITTIGLDIAKNVFQVHGVDENGKVAFRKQLKRSQVLAFFANLTPCLIGLETCGGANYWARELIKLGHDAGLISASGNAFLPDITVHQMSGNEKMLPDLI